MNTKEIETVDLSLASLIVAARLSQKNNEYALCEIISDYFTSLVKNIISEKTNYSNRVNYFLNLANEKSKNSIIPFTADPLTIQVASILLYDQPNLEFYLFSNLSEIDIGYIKCNTNQIEYIDHMVKKDVKKELTVFPELGIPYDLLTYFTKNPESTAKVGFADGGGDLISIDINRRANKSLFKSETRQKLFLHRTSGDGKQVTRKLGNVTLDYDKYGKRTFQLTGEQQLEVHAASFSDGWLQIGDTKNGLLSPVPDLDPDAPSKTGFITFPFSIAKDMNGTNSKISIEVSFAQSLFNRYQWITPLDQDRWLSFAFHKSKINKV